MTDALLAVAREAFISYASPDSATAMALVDSLEQNGVGCWIAPRDVVPGTLYADGIVRAINAANVFVVVLSAQALASARVGKEIERASSKGRPIFAVRTDTAPLSPAFEYFLSESQWIEVGPGGLDAAAAKLVAAIQERSPSKRAPDANLKGAPKPSRTSRWRFGSAVAAALVIAVAIAWLLTARFPVATSPPADAPTNPPIARGAVSPAVSAKSIAVLPFADMSENQDQEYFADGVAEEILDRLANVPGLHVIGRTSSFQFKGKNEDLRAIGATLGVAHLVEGSVRRSGDRVRVTAQLIRAADGAHAWSNTYERTIVDVLKMQEEIATGIARALQITIEERALSAADLRNPEAYDLSLRGLHAFDRYDEAGFEAAANYFDQALELEPSFTRAAEYRAWTYFLQADWGYVRPEIGFEGARQGAERLLALDPNSTMGHGLLARIYTDYDWQWEAARREAATTVNLAPRWYGGHFALGVIGRALGQFDDAERSMKLALSLDPLNPDIHTELGNIYFRTGRFGKALEQHRRALKISPYIGFGHHQVADDLLALGHHEAALAEAQLGADAATGLSSLVAIYHAMGRHAESDRTLNQYINARAGDDAYSIASAYAYRGEVDEALVWLDRAYEERDFGLTFLSGHPWFLSLKDDPRFRAFLRKMNIPE